MGEGKEMVMKPLLGGKVARLGLAALLAGMTGLAVSATTPEDLFQEAESAFMAGTPAVADAKLADFRTRYPSHPLYWKASLMWARCAPDPDEAARRLALVARTAPAGTKAECELDLASLSMARDRFVEAEEAFGKWLIGHGTDERAPQAAYLRGICLAELGRTAEAEVALEPVYRKGASTPYRALAGLSIASARFSRGLYAEARMVYAQLIKAPWAGDVRPQVLFGAAKCAAELKRPAENQALLARLVREYPNTEEGIEAQALLKIPARARIWVQVGAFSRADFAKAEKAKWEAKGYPASLGVSRHGSLKLNTMLLGPYATRLEAERVVRTLRASGTGAFVTRY
jgi:TolA-binding protein